jgi:UDP-glucose-4-epimerase GalE
MTDPPAGPAGIPLDETVLVTGGAGYIGLQTVRLLRRSGLSVVALDRRPGPPAADLLGAAFERLDVRDTVRMTRILGEHAVTAVVHCAGRKSAPESLRAPGDYFDDNVGGTLSLLQAMVAASVSRLVFSSSCAVYGHPTSLPITETAALAPLTPYAETKLQAERQLHWFGIAHGLRYLALRYFNAGGAEPDGSCGEDESGAENLLPMAVVAARDGKVLTAFGTDYPTPDGSAVRDYVHVGDVARAHLDGLGYLARGGASAILNLGTGRGWSVFEVADAVRRLGGRPLEVRPGPRREGDPAMIWADARKAADVLGWKAKYSLDDIVLSAWRSSIRRQGQSAGDSLPDQLTPA